MKEIYKSTKHNVQVIDYKTYTLVEYKKQEVSHLRKIVEQGGVYYGDIIIKTDEGSISKISSALAALQNGMVTTLDWKGENGWIKGVDVNIMADIGTIVSRHVQHCFTTESLINDEIDNSTEEELYTYDVNAAWDRLFPTT